MWVQTTNLIDCWIFAGLHEHFYLSFPGLAYCRHLSTVRTHLSALVNTTIVDPDVPCGARGGLSVEVWNRFLKDSSVRFTQRHQSIRYILVLINYTNKWLFKSCVWLDLMLFRPTRKRRYTGLCILVVWPLHYAKRSGPSCWDTTSSPWLRNAG